jgi:hypothetical protein
LNIKWQQVQEGTRSKQVRFRFCNTRKVETFIFHRTAKYLDKVARSNERTYTKKFLDAGMNKSQKNGGVQHTCNNTFSKAISAILPGKKMTYTINAVSEIGFQRQKMRCYGLLKLMNTSTLARQ